MPFIFQCFHSKQHTQLCEKKHSISTYQTRKSFFFFLLLQMGYVVQNCMTLSQWVSHKTATFYTEQCTSPSLFHNFEVTRGASNWSLKNYGFSLMPSFFTCMHVQKSLSNKTNYYSRLLNQNCWLLGESLSIIESMFAGQ